MFYISSLITYKLYISESAYYVHVPLS